MSDDDTAIVDYDYAIVGGGVAGVYTAWRLLSAGKGSVCVFEGSNRIGGRLLSARPPGVEDMVAELGGMRYIPKVQPRVQALIDVLRSAPQSGDKPIDTFEFDVSFEENLAYTRGTHLRDADFIDHPDKVPYELSVQERGKSVGQLLTDAIEQIVPGITNEKLEPAERRDMAYNATFDGVELYKQGFWQVLMRVMSPEAYQLARAMGGYQSIVSNWNAAAAIPWFLADFGEGVQYMGFTHGYQEIPLMIAERVRRAEGGRVAMQHRLRGFEVDEREGIVVLALQSEGGPVTVRARNLVLAMPRRALELVTPHSPLLQGEEVKRRIGSVTPRPLFKLFTTYAHPWWRSAGVSQGRSVTDLPARQTIYWPTNAGKPAKEGPAMLMASYGDGLEVGFWDGLRDKRSAAWGRGPANGFTSNFDRYCSQPKGIEDVDERWTANAAPKPMVLEVQRQMQAMHGLSFTPHPICAAYHDWGADPYGGGWNSWNIGVRPWELVDEMVHPDARAPVFICGEAYSGFQGWVEGALETADKVLALHGVDPLPLEVPSTR